MKIKPDNSGKISKTENILRGKISNSEIKEPSAGDYFLDYLKYMLSLSPVQKSKSPYWRAFKKIMKEEGHWKNKSRGKPTINW